jgi:hypothetical protein
MHINDVIQALQDELKPHSELSKMMDDLGNYDISVIHHQKCITIIQQIQHLRDSIVRRKEYALPAYA